MPDEQGSVWTAVTVVAATAAVVLVAAVVLGLVVPGISAPGAASDTDADHENPNSVETGGQFGQLERQLAARLRQQVESGAINLSREDYERAREQVGDERYEALLDEYDDVASGTDAEGRQQRFRRAQRTQQIYTLLVADYWDRYEDYETITELAARNPLLDSVDTTNSTRLRAIARDLERTTRNLTATANRTIALYEALDAATDESYGRIITSIADSRENITETQQRVREQQFVATTLTLTRAEPTRISPTEPLVIEGRLTTAEGEPLANEPVPLDVGEQVLRPESNATGWFATEYRPAVLPTNATALTIRYAPGNESIYLGDAQTRNVTVGSARPRVTLDASPATVRYNETVTLTGSVGIDGATFPNVPYGVFLGGELLVRNETTADGAIRESVRVPAAVGSGEQELTVRLLLSGQALTSANGSTMLAVEESPTRLSVAAEPTDEGTLLVSGQLDTMAGVAVDDQPLELSVNGTVVGTARTDERGAFRQQVVVPEGVETGRVTVRAAYHGEGSNLAPASATATTTVTAAGGGLSLSPLLAVPLVVLAALGGGYLLVARLSGRRTDGTPSEGVDTGSDAPVAASAETPSYLDRASEFLEAGEPAAAVQAGYAAVQHHLGDGQGGQTHWEFYRDARERLDEDARVALRRATERYERARFAPTAVDASTAREALDAVEEVTETDAATPADD